MSPSLRAPPLEPDDLAARLEQLKCDVADVVFACKLGGCLSSVLESAASIGRHELLGALLERLDASSFERNPACAALPDVPKHLSAALLAAADMGHPQCIKLLLEFCISSSPTLIGQLLDARDSRGQTALMKSTAAGHMECMQLLLEHSPLTQVAAVNCERCNALRIAAYQGHTSCVQLLLTHSPYTQVAAIGSDGSNALMWACLGGHPSCLQLLLAHSPDMQLAATDTAGWNALMYAASKGHSACIQILLARNADMQVAKTTNGASALTLAADRANVACLQLLLAHSPSRQQLDKTLLRVCRYLADLTQQKSLPPDEERTNAFRKCAGLLLANNAMMPTQATEYDKVILRPIIQELAARAVHPDMGSNEAVVSLALAATRSR